jgi:hypothetical protein
MPSGVFYFRQMDLHPLSLSARDQLGTAVVTSSPVLGIKTRSGVVIASLLAPRLRRKCGRTFLPDLPTWGIHMPIS